MVCAGMFAVMLWDLEREEKEAAERVVAAKAEAETTRREERKRDEERRAAQRKHDLETAPDRLRAALQDLSSKRAHAETDISASAANLVWLLNRLAAAGYSIPRPAAVLGKLARGALETPDLAEPSPPVPPERAALEKPEYHGAKRIVGEYVGPYRPEGLEALLEEGVILKSGRSYYVILNARATLLAAVFRTQQVFATPEGRTVTLNIGRTGREAAVFKMADKETYDEDQRSYKAELADAKKAYAQALREYRSEAAAYPKKRTRFEDEKRKRDAEKALALTKRQTALRQLPDAARNALDDLSRRDKQKSTGPAVVNF
jgi:hypothetical protein